MNIKEKFKALYHNYLLIPYKYILHVYDGREKDYWHNLNHPFPDICVEIYVPHPLGYIHTQCCWNKLLIQVVWLEDSGGPVSLRSLDSLSIIWTPVECIPPDTWLSWYDYLVGGHSIPIRIKDQTKDLELTGIPPSTYWVQRLVHVVEDSSPMGVVHRFLCGHLGAGPFTCPLYNIIILV